MMRPSKYRAIAAYRCETCGADPSSPTKCIACGSDCVIRFDSRAEARRWDLLRFSQNVGQISELDRQVPFSISVHRPDGQPVTISTWRADFVYLDETGNKVVEDVKSGPTKTATYRLKKKAVEAIYGIEIREVTG